MVTSFKDQEKQLAVALKKVEVEEANLEEAKRKLGEAKKSATTIRKKMQELKKEERAKDKKKRNPQELQLISKFPLTVKDRKIEAVFEAFGGNLKWPAILYSDGYHCNGKGKKKAKCKLPNYKLPENHSERELKEIIYIHAACCLGERTGRRPEFPILR